MKGTTLLLADEIVVPLSTTLSSLRDIGVVVDEKDLLLITQASALTKLPAESASLDTVVSIVKTSGSLGNQYLEDLTRVLKPDGSILVQTYLDSSEDLKKSTSALERKLLLSGLVEVHVDNVKPILPADGCQVITVKAKKASWTVGQSFSLKKTTAALPKIQLDDESDLIDEDSLLTEEDLKKPIFKPVDDCELGSTRKACKNCTCGRAEVEAAAEKVPKLGLTGEQINNPQSACGSCGLGDAFRCGTCPYKGLPPFKPGEKVSLGNFLVADI